MNALIFEELLYIVRFYKLHTHPTTDHTLFERDLV